MGARQRPGPLDDAVAIELRDSDEALGVSDDLAARDLWRVRNGAAEVLAGDPLADEHGGLVGLLAGLEQPERAHDTVARLDQVVAGEAGKLAQLRHERLVHLARDLACARHVDAFITTDGREHVVLLLLTCRAARSSGRTAASGQESQSKRKALEPRRLQQQEPTR